MARREDDEHDAAETGDDTDAEILDPSRGDDEESLAELLQRRRSRWLRLPAFQQLDLRLRATPDQEIHREGRKDDEREHDPRHPPADEPVELATKQAEHLQPPVRSARGR